MIHAAINIMGVKYLFSSGINFQGGHDYVRLVVEELCDEAVPLAIDDATPIPVTDTNLEKRNFLLISNEFILIRRMHDLSSKIVQRLVYRYQ